MTPAEAKKFIADRLAPKMRATLTGTDFVGAWNDLSDVERNAIFSAAIDGNTKRVGEAIQKMLNRFARAKAETRAGELIANGSLDLAEFSEVFD